MYKDLSFDLLTSGVRSGIRRGKLPGSPIKNGDSTRRPGDGGRQTGSSRRDGGHLEAQPAVNQRHGSSSSKPNSQGIYGAGRSCELHDWMEDARNRLPSVPAAERLPFLIAHLEGPAREEVRYAPEEEKDSVDKIVILLLSTFGETRSNAQLKRELYERRQRNRESVREFSLALLEISKVYLMQCRIRTKCLLKSSARTSLIST